MNNIINIMGSPKSFTTSAYGFIRNLGVKDLVKNSKESCYFFDNDLNNLKKDKFHLSFHKKIIRYNWWFFRFDFFLTDNNICNN